MQRRALIGFILVIVSLVLIGISLVMPWYTIKMEAGAMGVSTEADINYYLDHAESNVLETTETINYDDEGIKDAASTNVFKTTQIMVFLGLIGCILGLVGAALVMTDKMNSKVGAMLVLVAFILALLAPIYIMVALPGAYQEEVDEAGGSVEFLPEGMGKSFFGSEESSTDVGGFDMTTKYSWGGGTGWIFALIAFILLLVALLMVAGSKPAIAPAPQPQPQPTYTQPAYQQPQQPQQYPPQTPPPTQPTTPPPTQPTTPPPPPPPPR
jgi:uncharacterized membrane protein